MWWFVQASAELQGIKGMWSLRASSSDVFDTFLVVSFISETRVLAMNADDELEETEIDGFDSEAQTLFCHNAVHDQLVQVSTYYVFLLAASQNLGNNHLFIWGVRSAFAACFEFDVRQSRKDGFVFLKICF
jgi:hypothetical protein